MFTDFTIKNGWIQQSPVGESRAGWSNWLAKLDPKSNGNQCLTRTFAEKTPNGGRQDPPYKVEPWLTPGTVIEFGAKRYQTEETSTGRRVTVYVANYRWVGIVRHVSTTSLSVEQFPSPEDAFEKLEFEKRQEAEIARKFGPEPREPDREQHWARRKYSLRGSNFAFDPGKDEGSSLRIWEKHDPNSVASLYQGDPYPAASDMKTLQQEFIPKFRTGHFFSPESLYELQRYNRHDIIESPLIRGSLAQMKRVPCTSSAGCGGTGSVQGRPCPWCSVLKNGIGKPQTLYYIDKGIYHVTCPTCSNGSPEEIRGDQITMNVCSFCGNWLTTSYKGSPKEENPVDPPTQETQDLRETLKFISQKIKSMHREDSNSAFDRNIGEIRRKLDHAQDQLDAILEGRDQLAKELDLKIDEATEVAAKSEQHRKDAAAFRGALEDSYRVSLQQNRELGESQARITELTTYVHKLEAANVELTQERDKLKSTPANKDRAATAKMIEALKEDIRQRQEQYTSREKAIATLQANFESTLRNRDKEIAHLRTEIHQANQIYAGQQETRQALEARIEAQASFIKRLQEMSKETPVTLPTNPSIIDRVAAHPVTQTVKADANDAAWRLAGSQFVKLVKEPLVAVLMRHLGTDDPSMRARLAAFLDTEIGSSVLAAVLSVGLSALPALQGNDIPGRLARELRVKSMAGVGDVIADLLMGPLRQVAVMYLSAPPAEPLPGIPALSEGTMTGRVDFMSNTVPVTNETEKG